MHPKVEICILMNPVYLDYTPRGPIFSFLSAPKTHTSLHLATLEASPKQMTLKVAHKTLYLCPVPTRSPAVGSNRCWACSSNVPLPADVKEVAEEEVEKEKK